MSDISSVVIKNLRLSFSFGSGVDTVRYANCTELALGDFVEPAFETGDIEDDAGLDLGGNGTIPTPLRSLAADAYVGASLGRPAVS